MKKQIKLIILTIARATGCFKLSRWITRRDLRILTYHGMALDDEWAFRGGLFISPATFERRMGYLAKHGFPVLELGDAVDKLQQDAHQDYTTVITIDDGWYGTASLMAPILKKYGFASTLYLCSYYMEKQTQVFNVAADYLLWKGVTEQLDLKDIDDQLEGVFTIKETPEREKAAKVLWDYSNSLGSAEARQSLLLKVCKAVGLDPDEFVKSRLFTYMTPEQAGQLVDYGMDVQLHTHRHEFPATEFKDAEKEIEDNRDALRNIAPNTLKHFCYPSGIYEQHQLDWLHRMNIETATTTIPGFNTPSTGKLELKRFLDWEQFTDVEFEAEVCGFIDLLQRAKLV